MSNNAFTPKDRRYVWRGNVSWLELWAKIQVIGTIIGLIIGVLFIIIAFIDNFKN